MRTLIDAMAIAIKGKRRARSTSGRGIRNGPIPTSRIATADHLFSRLHRLMDAPWRHRRALGAGSAGSTYCDFSQ
jgi:hypothetical protein